MTLSKTRFFWATCLPLALGACAITAPPAQVPTTPPVAWQAPLPHQGSMGDLTRWWTQLGDPLLVELIDAAQAVRYRVFVEEMKATIQAIAPDIEVAARRRGRSDRPSSASVDRIATD